MSLDLLSNSNAVFLDTFLLPPTSNIFYGHTLALRINNSMEWTKDITRMYRNDITPNNPRKPWTAKKDGNAGKLRGRSQADTGTDSRAGRVWSTPRNGRCSGPLLNNMERESGLRRKMAGVPVPS
ncbi:hypothetical protein J6590_039290 [Homalodisca vitripennis]|nr:hypothetical protein J6590_039290 [Homalodisca vitripennis]